ncbi:MAG: PBP1A family penicillin-binding protein [Candidatus Eremiobacteraeota bacterium]|nr:PBP1A family penicillin-binding protein [Candidatus Eremiobacteraeota bacterium]
MSTRAARRPAARTRKRGPSPPDVVRGVGLAVAVLVLFFLGTVAGVVASYSSNLPDINRMADFQPSRSTRVFARDGSLLANLYRQNRIWVPIRQVPVPVRNAFIANEDQHFYSHHGIDFGGILRAAWADYRHQSIQGASTITQQLARGLFLSNEVSVSRKIQEALLAIEIERYYTKDEILERYLNLVYFGAGAYGIEAAAHTYFAVDVGRLSIGQAAMLAGILAAPSDYSPYVNHDLARQRERHVLDRMASSGFITREEADAAYDAPLELIPERPVGLQSYVFPYFSTYATHVLEQLFGTQATFEGGLQVFTTLDPRMQRAAQEAIDWGVRTAKVEGINAHQAALVAVRPTTGEILAMVGGDGWSLRNQFNRAWQARRQPGSSFKIYVYTAAIDSGIPPTAILYDNPVSYPMGDGTIWAPQDDDHRYMGAITMRTALAQSRNIAAVRLAEQIGINRVIEYAKRMGVDEPLEPNLSLALGSSVVSPLDMATGFATLANAGIRITPSPIKLVKDSFGSTILDNRSPQETEVVSAGTAFVMTQMLTSVIKEGTGYPNAEIGRPAAGKTGTTSDFRDAWFDGFTPDLVAVVWLGNDNYAQMNESYGGNIPARTWARFMKAALAKTKPHDFTMPVGEVSKVRLCSTGRIEYFLAGTAPRSCGPVDEPPARPHRAAAEKEAAPALATPQALATPSEAPAGVAGDGEHFERLDNGAAPSAPPR